MSASHHKETSSEFWEEHPHAEQSLSAWFEVVNDKNLDWTFFADVRATFNSADMVGNCTVFNIGGNNFRMITRIKFRSHIVYVLKIMTHSEYDRDNWKDSCGCFQDSPEIKD